MGYVVQHEIKMMNLDYLQRAIREGNRFGRKVLLFLSKKLSWNPEKN